MRYRIFEISRPWLILRYYFRSPKELGKDMINIKHCRRYFGRDSNSVPPKCETGLLTTTPRRFMYKYIYTDPNVDEEQSSYEYQICRRKVLSQYYPEGIF
jgi:hypothetical protein